MPDSQWSCPRDPFKFNVKVLLVTVSWTLSLSLSCMSAPTLKPSSLTLPIQTFPTRPTSLQKPWQRHRLRLEDVRHRLSASALQKVERETNRLRKNRRSRKFPKVPATSCIMSTRSLVEKKGMCTKSGGLCRVGPNFFYDQKCFGDTSSSACSAMVEEHQTVVGTCLLLMGTTPACRHSPPDGPSVVMPEHKDCPPPAPAPAPVSKLSSAFSRPISVNVTNTDDAGSGQVDIW